MMIWLLSLLLFSGATDTPDPLCIQAYECGTIEHPRTCWYDCPEPGPNPLPSPSPCIVPDPDPNVPPDGNNCQ